MSTLQAYPSVALDEDAHEFISRFMSHVATIAGRGRYRRATIDQVRMLLVDAIGRGDGASATAWTLLYQTISELVARANTAYDSLGADAYLQSFLRENVDLARSE
jgi:hypothetical protein